MHATLPTLLASLTLLSLSTAATLPAQEAQPKPRRAVGIAMTIEDDGPMVIDHVVAGSPAEKAGLKAGDQVLMIAGMTAAQLDPDALGAIVDTARVIAVVVRRGGERLTFEVEPAAMPPGSMPESRVEMNTRP